MANSVQQRVREELAQARTRERMVRTARRVVGERESEDAAHDAVVQALAASERFREDARVGTWLFRIAINAALMNHRHAARAKHRLSRAKARSVDDRWLGMGHADGPGAAVEALDSHRRLRAAVERLPPAYREVIELCVYAEQPPANVSGALGITPSAVRTRFSRAQDRLRKMMATGG